MKSKLPRCVWVNGDPLYISYHDAEWGVPVGRPSNTDKSTSKASHAGIKDFSSLDVSYDMPQSEKIISTSHESTSEQELIALKARFDDKTQFEFLTLESAQAGLSWLTILRRREGYSRIFHNFDVQRVAKMTEAEIQSALIDPGIIRNKLKVRAAVKNAQVFLEIQNEFETFSKYIWSFVGGSSLKNNWDNRSQVPSTSKESDALSVDLKKRGMSFVGSTIIYAHMQATGLVNDHTVDCFRCKDSGT